jgi:hypothetical protein
VSSGGKNGTKQAWDTVRGRSTLQETRIKGHEAVDTSNQALALTTNGWTRKAPGDKILSVGVG